MIDAGQSFDGGADAGPDAGSDAGFDAGSGTDGGIVDAGALAPIVYPFGVRHSPVTAAVTANLKRIAGLSTKQGNVFSRVGDSQTVSTNFMNCFAGANVDLNGLTPLQATIDQFKSGPSFTRVSLAATVGWSAGAAIAGAPSPLDQEVAAVSPRYALVMFGTNDIGDGTGDVFTFARRMFLITDQLIAAGVVPLLTTVPPVIVPYFRLRLPELPACPKS